MALTFPSNPTTGQVWINQGITFVWSGLVWHVLDPFPWATNAEGQAGTRRNALMTPAAAAAALNQVPVRGNFGFGNPTLVTASRLVNTNYQNNRDRPAMINVQFWERDDTPSAELRTGAANAGTLAVNLAQQDANRGTVYSITGVIPARWWWRLNSVARRPSITAVWDWSA